MVGIRDDGPVTVTRFPPPGSVTFDAYGVRPFEPELMSEPRGIMVSLSVEPGAREGLCGRPRRRLLGRQDALPGPSSLTR